MFDHEKSEYQMKEFFSSELKINNELFNDNPKQFYNNRKIGENESYFCKIIREDLIEEFKTFANKKQLNLSSLIPESIFETNLLLMKHQPTIIEYAAFFGSSKIFKYLRKNDQSIPPSIWLYAIHGQNNEILSFLQRFKINNDIAEECIKIFIKGHNNQATIFFFKNYLNKKLKSRLNLYTTCLSSYNFGFFINKASKGVIKFNEFLKDYVKRQDQEVKNIDIFFYLCKNNYFDVVDFLFKINQNNSYPNIIQH